MCCRPINPPEKGLYALVYVLFSDSNHFVELENLVELTDFLDCALQVIGRIAMPPETIREVIGNRAKLVKAYNLCDGRNTLSEIAKRSRVDLGNLSRTTRRWIQHGIVFSVGEGRENRLLHIYPLRGKD